VVRFLTTIRMRYDPRLRLDVVMDNLCCHWTPHLRERASLSNVELVPTPTYASYLNRIECHFWAIQEFVIKNADYDSWDELRFAMARHISYRNAPHSNRRLAELERRRRVA
jgi:transposase